MREPMSGRAIYINWPLSSFYGWGVYGLNLALAWSSDPDLAAASAHLLLARNVTVDPLRLRALDGFIQRSNAFHAQLEAFRGREASLEAPVISALDVEFKQGRSAHDVLLHGKPSVAATFFETTEIADEQIARAKTYPLIVTGSSWNTEVLRAYGLGQVRRVIQGIDPALFHPGPSSGLFRDRFVVFTGGKLERRKGQDIVIAAFRRFAERHPEALLVTAWGNPWNTFFETLGDSGLVEPLRAEPDGRLDLTGWLRANGVGADNVLDIGAVPNAAMGPILRDIDVAVFPNRAEGGTNLVAMECMACGAPTILSRNTGHLDLIEGDNCFPLLQQGALGGREAAIAGVAGWGESDVGEVLEALERVHADRAEARRRGALGAATLSRFTWAETAKALKAAVFETAA